MRNILGIITIFFTFALSEIHAQQQVTGIIYESSITGVNKPLSGANVYWLDTTVGTITDGKGAFKIPYRNEYSKLIVSYVGFKTDTITITGPTEITHWLLEEGSLDEVVIQNRRQTTFRSHLQAQNINFISSDELLKAACCNLSESFETNPSIDVNFPDALTGTRQIRMLGLASQYTLFTLENIPAMRGAAQPYGLSFVPGTWVESIQVAKGAGSVTNGYESIAGQINAELQKPSSDDRFFLNLFAETDGRLELNNHLNFSLNEKWYTGLYIHGNYRDHSEDRNNDGFLDMPQAQQINLMNKWQYMDNDNGIIGFLSLKYLNDEKTMGQSHKLLSENSNRHDHQFDQLWETNIDTQRAEAALKLGFVFPENPFNSLGFQASYSYHNQYSIFGLRVYDIEHQSFYSSAMFSSIISDTRHNFKTGLSFTYDAYDEQVGFINYNRNEYSTGAYFEYSYDNLTGLALVAGLRADYNNFIGSFLTPRLHVSYCFNEFSSIRASVGRGIRSPNIFAENQQLFGSSRSIVIQNAGGNFYGLDAEDAWNYGISYLQDFTLFGNEANVVLDFYRTDFQNQIVVDWENPREVVFYNLDGKSYANSFQTELNMSPAPRTDIRLAYRLFDVKTDYQTERLEKPLTPKHRLFANAAYATPLTERGAQWKFDVTYNWLSDQRFPSTEANPAEFQRPARTPQLNLMNAQITKVFSPKFEIYVGGENITNVRQYNPIIASDDPFGVNFDSTLVYGPIFGSMYYTGLRWKL